MTNRRAASGGVEAAATSAPNANLPTPTPLPTPTRQQTNKKRQRQQANAAGTNSGDNHQPPQHQRKRRRTFGTGSTSGKPRPEQVIVIDDSAEDDEPAESPAAAASRPAASTASRKSRDATANTRRARPEATHANMAQFESNDYFKVLGLSRSASDADVKKAYRALAIQWHPDKNRENPQAEEYFKRIAEAYEVLSDPEKRRQYERYGKQGGAGGAGAGWESGDGVDATFSGAPFHSAGFSSRHARDIFASFFGRSGDPFDTPFFRDAGFAGRRHEPWGMDPFADLDDAFGFGSDAFGFPSMGRGGGGGRGGRHRSPFDDAMAFGTTGGFSSQTVSSSSSTDRHGHVVTTKTTTTTTPDGRTETIMEEFRNGTRVSSTSSSSSSRLADAGRMQLDSGSGSGSRRTRR